MWLDNLRELRIKAGNPSDKVIAEKSGVSTRNVNRLFAGEIKTPFAETLDHVVKALGFTLTDIFSETRVVIGDEKLSELTERVETVSAELDAAAEELDTVSAEHDKLVEENIALKLENAELAAELKICKMEIKYKDEIIAIHNYYTKRTTE